MVGEALIMRAGLPTMWEVEKCWCVSYSGGNSVGGEVERRWCQFREVFRWSGGSWKDGRVVLESLFSCYSLSLKTICTYASERKI